MCNVMLARSFNNDFVKVRKGSDSRALSRHASAVRTLMMNGRWIWVLINIYSFIDIIFTETIPGQSATSFTPGFTSDDGRIFLISFSETEARYRSGSSSLLQNRALALRP